MGKYIANCPSLELKKECYARLAMLSASEEEKKLVSLAKITTIPDKN